MALKKGAARRARQQVEPAGIVFLSSPQVGARGLKLTRQDTGIEVEEIWSSRRVQFYHGSSVAIGDWVYGSSGMTAPAFMTAVNIRTGELGWRERGIAKVNCVEADGKTLYARNNEQIVAVDLGQGSAQP